MWWSIAISVLSPAVAAVGLFIGWRHSRADQLRRNEVLGWANEAITVLQTVFLFCAREQLRPENINEAMRQLSIELSILLEKGRLFFRNTPMDDFGTAKEPAYRGIRPTILDELIVVHQLAAQWPFLKEYDRLIAAQIAESCERRFVSMAQFEVGRQRTAAVQTRQAGDGVSFSTLLRECMATGKLVRERID